MNFGTLSAIEMADTRNHTFDYERRSTWYNKDLNAAYSSDNKRDKCLTSRKMGRPHTWKLHLNKTERHISYIEVTFNDPNKKLSRTEPRKVMKMAKVIILGNNLVQLLEGKGVY